MLFLEKIKADIGNGAWLPARRVKEIDNKIDELYEKTGLKVRYPDVSLP